MHGPSSIFRANQLLEEVILFRQPFGQRQLRTIDRTFRGRYCLWREAGNAPGQTLDEGSDLGRLEDTVQIAPTLGRFCIEVFTSEQDFEGASPSHESGQALGATASGENAEGGLHLIHQRPLAHAEAHVKRLDELASATTHASLDLRDRDLPHRSVALAHLMEDVHGSALGLAVDGDLENGPYVEVRDEEVGIGALHDYAPHLIIAAELLAQHDEFAAEQRRRSAS